MNERKRLKKLLGDKYIFKIFLPLSEVRNILHSKDTHEKLFASLTVACVKINAIVFPNSENMQIVFDILVKDKPNSTEWICYDTITDEVKLSSYNLEQTMFDILNRVVKKYGLSYTDCNFEVVNGKVIKTE